MLNITFIGLLFFTFLNSSINESSEAEKIPENNQYGWPFTLAYFPTKDWLYQQIYPPSPHLEINPKDESQSTKSHSHIEDRGEEKILSNHVLDVDEYSDEYESSKKVDDILKIISDSSDEEKEGYLPFLKKFLDTVTNNPARYVKVLVKNTRLIVDLGIFKSDERRRNVENVGSLYKIFWDFIVGIYRAIYHFFMDRIEAIKEGAHKGQAAYERTIERDSRIWTEEKALQRLNELETQYKTMDKEELAKDITSLCMQALFKQSTYEKIVHFLDKLRDENIIEVRKLDKAFDYVVRYFIQNILRKDQKGQFAKDHNIS